MSFNRLKYDVSVQNLDNITAQKSCKYHLENPVSKKHVTKLILELLVKKVVLV